MFQKDWREQIDRAVDSGADWIDLIYPVSDLRLSIVQKVTRSQMLVRAVEAVDYACARAPNVRFAPTDTGRADLGFLDSVYKAVVAAGAKRVTVADTVGALHPAATAFLVRRAVAVAGVPVQVHFHDDFGLALANTVAAAEAGATILDGTVLGVGERAGNAPIEELAASLEALYGVPTGAKLERMSALAGARRLGVADRGPAAQGDRRQPRVRAQARRARDGRRARAGRLRVGAARDVRQQPAHRARPPERPQRRERASSPVGPDRRRRRGGRRARRQVRTTAEGQSAPIGDAQLLAMLERVKSAV